MTSSAQPINDVQPSVYNVYYTCIRTFLPCLFHTVYVIFGATGGIGSCLARRLIAQNGASVALVGRDQAKLDALAAEIGGGSTYLADVTDSKQVRACTAFCLFFIFGGMT